MVASEYLGGEFLKASQNWPQTLSLASNDARNVPAQPLPRYAHARVNTAEKVARLEEYLQRLQANAKQPHPKSRAKALRLEDGAQTLRGTQPVVADDLADAVGLSLPDAVGVALEAQRSAAERDLADASARASNEASAALRSIEEAAAKDAAQRSAQEAAQKAEREAAEKAAKEKAADKAAADKAAADKAAAAEKAAKEAAAEKAAAERAAKEAADKADKEKAAKEAADKAAAEKAAKEKAAADKSKDAAASSKKPAATIDELFEELELGGDTKVAPAVPTPSPSPVRAAAAPAPSPAPAPVRAAAPPPTAGSTIKDEITFDAADQPTLVADLSSIAAAEESTREAPAVLPQDAPTRVGESFVGLMDFPTVDAPTILISDKPGIDKVSEPDEPTVVRRASDDDRALVRGGAPSESANNENEEEPTVVRASSDGSKDTDSAAPPITPAPVISIGASSPGDDDDSGSPKSSSGVHEPKVALAEPLREAADREAKERAEKLAQEAALRPRSERKEKDRDEVTTASRRMIQLTPEAIAEEQRLRDQENKKPGIGRTLGLVAVTAVLVGAAWFVGLREGWFGSGGSPSPSSSTLPTKPGPNPSSEPKTTGSAPPSAPPLVPTAPPTTAPSTSVTAAPTTAPTAEPTAAPTVNPAASGTPGVPVVEKTPEALKLNATKGFLTVAASEELFVYVTGRKVGPTNQRHELNCGVGLVRLGLPLPGGGVDWRSAPGFSISIPCKASTTVFVASSKTAWPTSGGGTAPAPGGGGGTDPY